MSRSLTNLLRAALLGTTLIIAPAQSLHATDGKTSAASGEIRLLLSKLPDKGSDTYQALRSKAEATAVAPLTMTQSEVWTIPASREEDLRAAAQATGASVSAVGADWNTPLSAMPPSQHMTEKQNDMMSKAMASPAAIGLSMMALPDAHAMEYALINEGDGLHPAGELTIPLNASTTIKVVRTGLEKTSDGYVWHGTVEGTDDPVTLIWHMSGQLSGQINMGSRVFSVRHLGGGMHGVVEMQTRMLPAEHAPMDEGLRQKMKIEVDPLVTKGDASMLRPEPNPAGGNREPLRNLQDAASGAAKGAEKIDLGLAAVPPITHGPDVTITALVAYTAQAASYYADITQDMIELAIEDANQSFRNSGIGNVRLQLAHAYQTDYKEFGSHFEHVFRFADKDGVMDEVHGLRDQYKADVAVLVVHDPNGCGLAAGVAPPQDRAFAVVYHECAATKYSITHEIGHIIGARHDMALDDSVQPFAYGHGFVSGQDWRTMMSYEQSCGGCPRLPVWSNPRIQVLGIAAGDASADNARVIAEQAARVAAFR